MGRGRFSASAVRARVRSRGEAFRGRRQVPRLVEFRERGGQKLSRFMDRRLVQVDAGSGRSVDLRKYMEHTKRRCESY